MPAAGRAVASSGAAAAGRAAPLAAAAAGGALYALGFVGYGVWPLALVAWVPLWLALDAVRERGVGASAALGFAFGAAACVLGYGWLWRLVDVFLGGSVGAGALLFSGHGAWFAAGFALQALLFRAARRRGWPVAVAGVAPLVAVEWLYPALFPLRLGYALVDRPLARQLAELGGPLLLSALAGLANAAAFETLALLPRLRRGEPAARGRDGEAPLTRDARRGPSRAPVATLVATALAALAVAGYGVARTAALERALADAPSLRLGLVQANVGVLVKGRDPERVHRARVEQTRELLAADAVDLVVWPETVYTRGVAGPLPVSGALIRGETGVPLLFGAASVRTVDGRRLTFNSAFLVDADGTIRHGYDKNLLVPFAETVPLPALAPLFPHAQGFGAASGAPPLVLGPWRISTPICFEAVEPGYVRRMVAEARPHLIVSLANDGWFGDSQGARIHLAVARLRAVEHRRTLVRATNSGISAVVDPLGRVTARSRLLEAENLVASAPLLDAPLTLYGRAGDWPGALAAGLVACTLVLRPPGASRRTP